MKFKLVENNFKLFDDKISSFSSDIKNSLKELNNIRKYQTEYITEAHKNTKYIISDVLDKFVSDGGINLNGTHISSTEDLAVLSKIFRDTRYETFRIIFVRNDVVVGSDAFSCKIPDTTSALYPSKTITDHYQLEDRTFGIYKTKMKRLNADGYYLLHNHPTGYINPSNADYNVTKAYLQRLAGFKGHIILGKSKCGIITPSLEFHEYNLEDSQDKHSDVLNSYQSIISYINNHDIKVNNNALIFYCNTKLELIAVEEAELSAFKDSNFIKYIQNQAKDCGASFKFIVTDNQELAEKCCDYISFGHLTDVVYLDDSTAYSMRELNKAPIKQLPNKFFKTYRVKEE